MKYTKAYRKTDGLIMDSAEKIVYEEGAFGDEHTILLPARVFAFVLRNRKFGKFSLYQLEDRPYQHGGVEFALRVLRRD